MRVVRTLSLFASILTMVFLMESAVFAGVITFNAPNAGAPIPEGRTTLHFRIQPIPNVGTVKVWVIAESTIPKNWGDDGEGPRAEYRGLVSLSEVRTFYVPIEAPDSQRRSFRMTVLIENTNGTTIAEATHSGFSLNATTPTYTNVWPGDTNYDRTVDAGDVLPIGLYWGQTPKVRGGASNAWRAQQAVVGNYASPAWSHANASGDGRVDANEVLTVGLNWGKTHTGW